MTKEENNIVIPMGDYMAEYAKIYSELQDAKKQISTMQISAHKHQELLGIKTFNDGGNIFMLQVDLEKIPKSVNINDGFLQTAPDSKKYPSKIITFDY